MNCITAGIPRALYSEPRGKPVRPRLGGSGGRDGSGEMERRALAVAIGFFVMLMATYFAVV
jgi:hypothetical protein